MFSDKPLKLNGDYRYLVENEMITGQMKKRSLKKLLSYLSLVYLVISVEIAVCAVFGFETDIHSEYGL